MPEIYGDVRVDEKVMRKFKDGEHEMLKTNQEVDRKGVLKTPREVFARWIDESLRTRDARSAPQYPCAAAISCYATSQQSADMRGDVTADAMFVLLRAESA